MDNENNAVETVATGETTPAAETTPSTTASSAENTAPAAPASTPTNASTPSTPSTTTSTTPSTKQSSVETSTAKKGKKGAKGGSTLSQIKDLEQRKEALDKAIKGIQKDYGQGAVLKLGQRPNVNVEVVPTGILSIDAALGVGGLPRGRVIEIYGPESSGKTTLALHAVASCQKLGGTAAYIDAEHAMDPVYAEKIGVDLEELYVSQPDNGEQALDICEALVRSGAIDIVVVDSVAALVPKAEIEGDMGDSHVGLQARLMSQALRKLTGFISKTQCIVIFINQLREKVGVMYGNPEVTTGGKALKFYSTIRIDVRKSEAIKEGKEVVGNRTKIKIVKNKVAPPFKLVVVDMIYGQGISRVGDMLDIAVDMEIIKKSGSFYSLNPEKLGSEDRIGQGRDNARQYLIEHPDVADAVEKAIRIEMKKGTAPLAFDKAKDSDSDSGSKYDGTEPVDLDDDEEEDNEEFVDDTNSSGSGSASSQSADDKAYWDNELGLNK